jgi:hypothetical protein
VIFHPGILALLGGALLVVTLVAAACWLGLVIVCRWDRKSTSEQQLQLERRTYLVSSLVGYGFAFELASLLLFIYTVDELNGLFAGAMCATGVLNANPVGWPLLFMKIGSFFVCGIWLAVNDYDTRSDTMPLVRAKYGALLVLLPFFVLQTVLLFRYFTGLAPSIITSCCGTLFSSSETSLAGSLSGLPLKPMMVSFYAATLLYGIFLFLGWKKGGGLFLNSLAASLAVLYLGIALAAVVSFISVYIYQMPTHHCPFDMLQSGYGYVGYPLYISLFGSVFCAIMAGVAELLGLVPELRLQMAGEPIRWAGRALLLLVFFLVFSGYPLISGTFTLKSYL